MSCCESDAACQRADWPQHKAECAGLSAADAGFAARGRKQRLSVLEACRRGGRGVLSDVRLLLRLSSSLLPPASPCPAPAASTAAAGCVWRDVESARGGERVVQCCVDHVLDMCSGGDSSSPLSPLSAEDTLSAARIATRELSAVAQLVTQVLSKVLLSIENNHLTDIFSGTRN